MNFRHDVQDRIDADHAAILRDWLGQLPGAGFCGGAADFARELVLIADAMKASPGLLPAPAGVVRFLEKHDGAIRRGGWEWIDGRDMHGRWIQFTREGAGNAK